MFATFMPVCIPLDTKSWVYIPCDSSSDSNNDVSNDSNASNGSNDSNTSNASNDYLV